jgi:hypothetical protein
MDLFSQATEQSSVVFMCAATTPCQDPSATCVGARNTCQKGVVNQKNTQSTALKARPLKTHRDVPSPTR